MGEGARRGNRRSGWPRVHLRLFSACAFGVSPNRDFGFDFDRRRAASGSLSRGLDPGGGCASGRYSVAASEHQSGGERADDPAVVVRVDEGLDLGQHGLAGVWV